MNILGIDPDTKTTGIGMVDHAGAPIHGRLARVENKRASKDTRRLEMADRLWSELSDLRLTVDGADVQLIVIESQRFYKNSKVDANDLIFLANITGEAVTACRQIWPLAKILVPLPDEWKGSGRKAEFTKNALKRLGLETHRGLSFAGSKARLPGTQGIPAKDCSHIIDALAMARWAWLKLPRRV